MAQQKFAFDAFTVGTCYYPEHWQETLWADDLHRMQKAGISVIRIAEFAWSIFEREEGKFTFDLFDRFLSLCNQTGMKVIFGTPTATPPAWLTEKYPEVLNCTMEGVPYRHGSRRHYNYSAPIYREKTAIVVDALARHYGTNPAIIGWQIDNELNCETADFYSPADSKAFRVYLRRKYHTLDALNEAWGTVFWSQTYTDWEQVCVPRPTVSGGLNPHLQLDWLRFISDSCISFCDLQGKILRQYIPADVWVTTNGMFGHVDNHEMTDKSLDIYTYDSYPNFAYSLDQEGLADDFRDRRWSRDLTEVRSICPHFGVMEQQSGAGGWVGRMESAMPRPGQLTLWAMQSVAHGADYVSFFRWRTCTFGTEIYWHGLLDYDNRDNRRLLEMTEFAAKLKKLSPLVRARNPAAFAIVKDRDNCFDAQVDHWHGRLARESEKGLFEAAQWMHAPFDYVYLRPKTTVEELLAYPVLVMPHAAIITQQWADLLEGYVAKGGTLVLGCRTGYKEEHGQCVMLPPPGLLQKLSGSDVVESTFPTPNLPVPHAQWADGTPMKMPVFHDVLKLISGTKVLATYADGYYAGEAALTEHAYGAGRVLHLGATFDRENSQQVLCYAGVQDQFTPWMDAPSTVELVLREKAGRRYVFALNYQHEAVAVHLKQPLLSLLDEAEEVGQVTLPAYGVQVWRLP